MKKLITVLLTILVLQLTACSSEQTMFRGEFEKQVLIPENRDVYTTKRSKWSDKNMRIMVDPAFAGQANALEVQTLLVNQDRWTVITRGMGFESIKNEQNLIHQISTGRFENKEKWSHWGKLKGVGAIIIPYGYCSRRMKEEHVADLTLTMVDASTGEVIVAVRGDGKCNGHVENWEPLVEALADKYPHKFEKDQRYRNVLDYEEESKENALKKKFD